MRVGIDCRLWGIKHSGIGRYTEELVRNLQKIDKKNDYVIFCRKADFNDIPENKNWNKVVADIPHYGFAEQLRLPRIFSEENLDLLHVPHFNVPVLYTGKFVTTIHDLLWHEVKSWRSTTLSAPKYAVKYLAYRGNVRSTIARSKKIIVPTQTVKNDIVRRFGVPDDKVVVTYEGVAPRAIGKSASPKKVLDKYGISKKYILYVGNLYPHKNVELVVRATKLLRNDNLQLVIISSRNIFQDRFREFVKNEDATNQVVFTGRVPDEDLAALYKSAQAFVFPSLSEGFGLPGLEALASGLPLFASDIPVFREVYGVSPLYFDPTNPTSLAANLSKFFKDEKTKERMIRAGKKQAANYSWEKMAKQTLEIYTSAT